MADEVERDSAQDLGLPREEAREQGDAEDLEERDERPEEEAEGDVARDEAARGGERDEGADHDEREGDLLDQAPDVAAAVRYLKSRRSRLVSSVSLLTPDP